MNVITKIFSTVGLRTKESDANRSLLILSAIKWVSICCAAFSALCGVSSRAQITNDTLNLITQFNLPTANALLTWDGARRSVYCAYGTNVTKISLDTGAELGRISFTTPPQRMAVSPDGKELFVALRIGGLGSISVIGLDSFTQTRLMAIDKEPFDLVVVSSNLLAIVSGSGFETQISVLDAQTGEMTSSVNSEYSLSTHVALHPDGKRLYAIGGIYIQRFDLDPVARTVRQPGEVLGRTWNAQRVWAHPSGNFILGDDGKVLNCDLVYTNELFTVDTLSGGYFTSLGIDTDHGAFFTVGLSSRKLIQYNLRTLKAAAHYSLPQLIEGVNINENTLWDVYPNGSELWIAMSTNYQRGFLRCYTNPAIGGESNQPPTVRLSFTPPHPTTMDTITFDTGATTDDQPTNILAYQWYVNSDGTNRVAPGSLAVLRTNINYPGEYLVTVEVHDRFGEVSKATNIVTVTLAEDPGRLSAPHLPFQLPFSVRRVVFNSSGTRLYATDYAGKRLVEVDMDSGLSLREYKFNRNPDYMALSPNGRWLYVGLLNAPHSSFEWNGSGFVAEFDLLRKVKTHEFPIPIDPGYMVATDKQIVVVNGDSGQWTEVFSFDATNGAKLGSMGSRAHSPIALLPSQLGILRSSTFSSGAEIEVILIDPNTGALSLGTSRVQVNGFGGLSISPDGKHGALNGGGVFSIAEDGTPTGPALCASAPDVDSGNAMAMLFEPSPRNMVLGAYANMNPGWEFYDIRCFNLQNMYMAKSVPLTYPPTFLGRQGDRVYSIAVMSGVTYIETVVTPALGSETNQPPVASLVSSPATPTTRSFVSLDAGGSTGEGGLQFQWDFNGDGTIDIPWSRTNIITQQYPMPGLQSVRVDVRDVWGTVSSRTLDLDIQPEVDSGEAGPAHDPWQIPFAAADAAFDMGRRHVWLSDSTNMAIVQVNLDTGLIERQWRFDIPPESLAITPNGKYLYGALLTHAHSYYYRNQISYIAEFNLETKELIRCLKFDIDPGDIAATDNGCLFLSGASGGSTSVNCYKMPRANLLGSAQMYNGAVLCVSPSQTQVFAATTWDINPNITRFKFDPEAALFAAGPVSPSFTPERNGVNGKVFVLPGEIILLGGAGAVYLNSEGATNDLRVISNIGITPVSDMAAIPGTNIFAVVSGSRVGYYQNNTLQSLGVYSLALPAKAIGASTNDHFVLGVTNQITWIRRRVLPSLSSDSNLPPTLAWNQPAPGSVFTWPAWVHLSAIPEDVDGGIAWMQYRENGAVLATVTNAPFAFDTYSLSAGNHVIEAITMDNLGATSTPQRISLRLDKCPNVQWVTPTGLKVVDPGANVKLEVQTSDSDGSIAEIRFYKTLVVPTNLLAVVTNSPWSITVSNLITSTYFIAQALDNDGSISNTPSALIQVAGPNGDDFYRPFALIGAPVAATASSTNASAQLFEPGILGIKPSHSVWWRWTPPVTGRYTVSTAGSDFDTLLAIYTGTNISGLTLLAKNDDDPGVAPASSVKFTAYPGFSYAIMVDGYNSVSGTVNLAITLDEAIPPAPGNDYFANRYIIEGTNLSVFGNNNLATSESGEPKHDGTSAGSSVWWEWTAPTNGIASLTTTGSSFDTVVGVYTGSTSVSGLTKVASNDDDILDGRTSRLSFFGKSKTPYLIAVSGYMGSVGNILLGLDFTPISNNPPVNDTFAMRIELIGTNVYTEGYNNYATAERYEPSNPYGFSPQRTVWWHWKALGWGLATVEVQGASFTPTVGVFTGDSLNTMQSVANVFHNKTGVYAFQARAGVDYAFVVDSNSGSGPFSLILRAPNLISPSRLGIARITNGNAILDTGAFPGGTITVLVSSNLISWDPLMIRSIGPGEPLAIPVNDQSTMFYKVRFE